MHGAVCTETVAAFIHTTSLPDFCLWRALGHAGVLSFSWVEMQASQAGAALLLLNSKVKSVPGLGKRDKEEEALQGIPIRVTVRALEQPCHLEVQAWGHRPGPTPMCTPLSSRSRNQEKASLGEERK